MHYKVRDIPLSIGDVIDIENFEDSRKIRDVAHIIDRYVIYEEGQSLRTIPITDLADILDAILMRKGLGEPELKKSKGA